MRLRDKVAVITGAAQGIGASFATGFAREGAKVLVADILEGRDVVNAVEAAKGEALFVRTDVTDQEQCHAMAKAAFGRFGAIDILINNAALYGSLVLKPFTQITTEEWNHVMRVNTSGPFHCAKAVFPYMKGKGGSIINISSQSVLQGIPGMTHYVASKGAVMAFSRAMARELGHYNIRVNCIAPGFTHSPGGESLDRNKSFPMGPIEDFLMPQKCLKRASVPEDLLGTALFLASEDSAFITGQMINHDGGICFT
jgi:NAD(P)-dependent dehydrogenase (short-subunit alcohol dehydrogenase family)